MKVNKRPILFKNLFILLLLIALPLLSNSVNKFTPRAHASGPMIISGTGDTLSRSAAATASNHTIGFTVTNSPAISSGQTIIVTFPSAWTGLSTIVTADVQVRDTSGTPYTWPLTSATPVGSVLTIIVGTVATPPATNDYVEIKIGNSTGGTHQITNPAAGTYLLTLSGTTLSTTYTFADLITSATDQVGVSATVDPTLAFTMTDTTLNFGSLTTTSVRYANDTTGATSIPAQANTPLLTASTNGVSGVLISIYDVTPSGLYSATVSDTIPAAAVNGLVAGNKKFGVTGLSGSSLTATPGFNGTGAGGTGVISTTAQSFASSAGAVGSGNIAMIMVASIDALTHAGAYSDTVTVVCTGRF